MSACKGEQPLGEGRKSSTANIWGTNWQCLGLLSMLLLTADVAGCGGCMIKGVCQHCHLGIVKLYKQRSLSILQHSQEHPG